MVVIALNPALPLHFKEEDIPILLEKIKAKYGESAHERARAWLVFAWQSQTMDDFDKVVKTNDFFNQLTFIPDEKLWGKEDYWASMAEFIGAGGGDCEDFTLAKYYTLVFLGIKPESLKLVYVNVKDYNEAHMVLAYYAEGSTQPQLLDNLDKQVKLASLRPDLEPIYSFDTEDIWLHKQVGQGELIGKASTIKPWVRVLKESTSMTLNTPILNLDGQQ